MLQVIGSIFTGTGKVGDFGWMIRQPEYADALFVFNDNEEQFLAHRQRPTQSAGRVAGGGNAVIRPYQCAQPPRALGIPTGANGRGYSALTAHVRETIDKAISAIRELVAAEKYERLFYSAANAAGDWGTAIFDVADDVKRYMVEQMRGLQGA